MVSATSPVYPRSLQNLCMSAPLALRPVATPRSRRRPEARCAGALPGVTEARIVGAIEELARPQARVERVVGHDLARGDAAREVRRRELARMIEAGGGDKLGERRERR